MELSREVLLDLHTRMLRIRLFEEAAGRLMEELEGLTKPRNGRPFMSRAEIYIDAIPASRSSGHARSAYAPPALQPVTRDFAFIVPAVDRSAPRAIITAPFGPRKRSAASANGRSDIASVGSTPIHTA